VNIRPGLAPPLLLLNALHQFFNAATKEADNNMEDTLVALAYFVLFPAILTCVSRVGPGGGV